MVEGPSNLWSLHVTSELYLGWGGGGGGGCLCCLVCVVFEEEMDPQKMIYVQQVAVKSQVSSRYK